MYWISDRFWEMPSHLQGGHPGAWAGEVADSRRVALVNGSTTYHFPGERPFWVAVYDGDVNRVKLTRFSTVPKLRTWGECRANIEAGEWRSMMRLAPEDLVRLRGIIVEQTGVSLDD